VDLGSVTVALSRDGFATVRNHFNLPVAFAVGPPELAAASFVLLSPPTAEVLPGEVFNVSFRFASDELGRSAVEVPVATNATAPFRIVISAVATQCVFEFRDEEGRPVSEVEITDAPSDAFTHTLFLENVGLGEIVAPPLRTNASGFVAMKSACPARIGVGMKCRVELVIFPSKFQQAACEFACIAEGREGRATVTMKVELSRQTMKIVNFVRIRDFGFVVSIGSLPILLECWQKTNEVFRVRKDFDRRMALLRREIDQLSVSKRSAVAVQAALGEEEGGTGGKWIKLAAPIAPVSRTAIAFMGELLRSFQ
jgi:hypothetical protein